MYTINIKGKPNPKDPSMVKLEMIFFRSNYPRIIKVVNVTGLMSDWYAKSQSFRVGSAEATAKNKLLFDLKTKYYHNDWEIEGRSWSPVKFSHAFDDNTTLYEVNKDGIHRRWHINFDGHNVTREVFLGIGPYGFPAVPPHGMKRMVCREIKIPLLPNGV